MSIIIDDSPVALVAPSRARLPFAGTRLHADDAQPRLSNRSSMTVAEMAWRQDTGSTMRGLEAARQGTQDGRTGTAGTHVTANKYFSIRSGPPTSRP